MVVKNNSEILAVSENGIDHYSITTPSENANIAYTSRFDLLSSIGSITEAKRMVWLYDYEND